MLIIHDFIKVHHVLLFNLLEFNSIYVFEQLLVVRVTAGYGAAPTIVNNVIELKILLFCG